jgi:hypothetical protein
MASDPVQDRCAERVLGTGAPAGGTLNDNSVGVFKKKLPLFTIYCPNLPNLLYIP